MDVYTDKPTFLWLYIRNFNEELALGYLCTTYFKTEANALHYTQGGVTKQ